MHPRRSLSICNKLGRGPLMLVIMGFFSMCPVWAVHSNPPGTSAPSRPEIWHYQLDTPGIDTLMVDIEGNGLRDFLTLDKGKLYLRAETGFPLWRERNAELDAARVDSILTVCNLDAQGSAEILAAANGDLWVIDGGTMTTIAHMLATKVLGLTDLNSDGVAEVYTALQTSADPDFPPLEVSSLVKGKWTKLFNHNGCQLMRKPSQDAYEIGQKSERFYIVDLDNDEKPQEIMAALPAGKGWIGFGFDEKNIFGQKWAFTEIQDGTSRLKFLDWTDANGDTYYDILAYQYDTRRIFNSDVVSLGESIGSFPVRHFDEPHSSATALKTDYVKPGEWPMPHRDVRWTARSPLKLEMKEEPREAWNYVIGGAPSGLTLAELDGQPGADLLVSARGKLEAFASNGNSLWKSEYLGEPKLEGFYDLDGDGKNEMLVYYRKVYSEPTYAVHDPATGRKLWEFVNRPYIGGRARLQIGKFLPESKGLQIFTYGAFGYAADINFFDFSSGYDQAAKPVWSESPEHVIYPTEDIYDFDSNGTFEYILLEHSRLRIYEIATGKKLRDFEWGTYRSYGSMLPVKIGDDPYFKLLIMSWNSMSNVEMVDINATSGSLKWKVVGKVGFRVTNTSDTIKLVSDFSRIGDVDGDGQLDVVYLKSNESGDRKWHGYVRDAWTGKLKKDAVLASESWDEAGFKKFDKLPEQPKRPVMAEPTPKPAGSIKIADASAGKIEVLDETGKVVTRVEAPETITGAIYRPLVADLNDDGKPEIIIPKGPSAMNHVYKGDYVMLNAPGSSGGQPTVVREENAEMLLIFDRMQQGRNDRLYLEEDPQGSRLVLKDNADKTVWTSVIPSHPDFLQQSAYGDFNGDGVLDIFLNFYSAEMNTPTPKKIWTINGEIVRRGAWDGKDGRLLWHACNVINERPFDYASHPIVYDVNADGKDDVLSLCPDILTVASGDTGKLIYDPRYTKAFWRYGGGLYCIPFVDDLDGDGNVEIYGQRAYGGLAVMRLPNEPMWSNGLEDQGLYASVTDTDFQGIADVDGDDKMEIGTGLRKGDFRCFAAEDGHVQWSYHIGSPTTDVCSADVDGDGKYEFIFGTESGFIYALSGGDDEKNPVKWKKDLGASVGAPLVADVDGDGKGEILVMTGDGRLRCLKGQ